MQRRVLVPGDGSGEVTADVFVPDVEDAGDPQPAAVFLQGGAVTLERYRWLGFHLAAHGAVVAAPTHPFNLAFFAQDHAQRALEGLRAGAADESDALLFGRVREGPAVIVGHSLGGVVATKAWLNADDGEVLHLALLASFPDTGDAQALAGRTSGRVVSLVGDRDEKATAAEVNAGAAAFADADVVVIEGMNHYQWTDEATASEIDSDGEPTRSIDDVRASALPFLVSLIDDACDCGRGAYAFGDDASWPEGASAP